MTNSYTYRDGEKVIVVKKNDEFIIRSLPDVLKSSNFDTMEQTSSFSTRVKTASKTLENEMNRARESFVAHHAYEIKENAQPLLITDRITLSFKNPPDSEQLDHFINSYALEYLRPLSETVHLFRLTNDTHMNPLKLIVKLNEEEKAVLQCADHDLNHNVKIKSSFSGPSDEVYPNQQGFCTKFLFKMKS